jgi:hypothetical protein
MSPIRRLHLALLGALCLSGVAGMTAATAATLGEAVRAADSKYLETPEIGMVDDSPRIVAGGGEDGLPPMDEEVSLGPVRVTLTYVEEEPEPENKPSAHELPEEAGEAPLAEETPGEAPVAPEEIPLEDIPEEAMLPGEFDLGETVWRRAVVTVHFDDPNPKPAEAERTDETTDPASDEPAPEDESASAAPAGPRVVATLQGPSTGVSNPSVSIQIAELDPNNPFPEVVVSFFTGGAHCCSVTRVVTSTADGSAWTTLDVGEFDGGPMLAVDLDRDGTYEFETRDNAFLYAFACYACSEAPLQMLAIEDGKIKDVSAAPRFRPAHAAWLKNMIVGVPEQEVNGFLAGYVAQKARLGEGKQAWDLMLKYYDRNSDWGLEICDQERDESGECLGETTKVTFPEALELMLKKNGYKVEG